MHRLVSQISVVLLCLFSITITILVWSNVGNTTTESILLSIAAMGIESAKYVLIPSALILWRSESQKPIAALCVLLMVGVVFVSVGTMVTYFDSRVTQQKSILSTQAQNHDVSQRITEQQLQANQVIISAGEKLVAMDHLTKGAGTVQNINKMRLQFSPKQYTASLFTVALPDDPFHRQILLAVIALAIDLTSMALISMLFLTAAKLPTNIGQSRLDNHPLNLVRQSILNWPKTDPINISEIKISHNVDRRKVDQLVSEMYSEGELVKQSNRYYLPS